MSKRNRNKRLENKVKKTLSILDVCVPVYGQYPATKDSINNLKNACENIPFKLYMVDDASKDYEENGKPFYEWLRTLDYPTNVTHLTKNGGFARTVNYAVNQGTSEYILVMSTDVVMLPDSVRIMVEHMQHNPQLGIIAPKLLFFPNSKDPQRPAGKVQSVGMFFDSMGNPYHPFSGWDNEHSLVNIVRDLNAITGAVFLIRRTAWNKVSGFSTDYGKGTYEDIDLSLRVKMAGYGIRVLPQATGYHYANLSVIGAGEGFPLEQNKNIFNAKFSVRPYDAWILSGRFHEQ